MKRRNTTLLCSVLSSALLLGTVSQGWASEAAEPDFFMEEYIVTASRVPVKVTETAASVTVITKEIIERENLKSVPEVLNRTGIMMDEDVAHGSAPLINGDGRILVLVDGRKVNWERHDGINLNMLPNVKSIERVEVVRGPASSLYGSDAVGGVINIITRKAVGALTTAATEVGSWGLRRYQLNTEGSEKGIQYRLNVERKHEDGYSFKNVKTGEVQRAVNSDKDQDTINLRLDKEVGADRTLTLDINHSNGKEGINPMPDKNLYDSMYSEAVSRWGVPNPQDYSSMYFPTARRTYNNTDVSLTYRWGNAADEADGMLRLYRNHSDYDIDKMREGRSLESTKSLRNTAVGAEWQQRWKLNEKHTLVGGIEWRHLHDKENEIYANVSLGVRQVDAMLSNSAAYLEERWNVSDAWTVSVGARYDDHSIAGGKSTARITVNRKINEAANAYISWGQVFRAPTMENFYGAGFTEGNLNLRPETGDTLTIGLNAKIDDKTRLQTSVFSSRLKDAISYRATGAGVYQYVNLNEEKKKGFDITLSRRLSPAWQASVGYYYVKIQDKQQGASDFIDNPDNSQPNGYRFNLNYNQDKWEAALALRGASGRNLQAFTSKSSWVMDVTASYKLNEDTKAYFKVYNLTNQAYELRGSYTDIGTAGGYPMTSRHFFVGVERKL